MTLLVGGFVVLFLVLLLIDFFTMSTKAFSPRDFFLWLAAMVTLYVSAFSLGTLLFNYIDILFPDALDATYYYYDPYSATVRFAIASLVIVFPLFLALTRAAHQDIRKNPEKSGLGIRKWLVFLTIFAAGAILTGDLIALVNTFLNGEITTRFILKVLVIIVIAGGVLWYYLSEIRGKWEKDEQLSKIIGGGVAVVVLASIVAGFVLIGTPGDARALRFDQERRNDLQAINLEVAQYWQAKRTLPETLDALAESGLYFDVPTDPETNEAYGYSALSDETFELCATFSRSSDKLDTGTRPVYSPERTWTNWDYEAGEYCFERTIDPDFYPPLGDEVKVPLVR